MKKFTSVLIAAAFVFGSAAAFAETPAVAHKKPVAAAKAEAVVVGKVLAVNVATSDISVQTKAGETKSFTVSAKAAGTLKVGENVKVYVKTGTTNVADKVLVVGEK